MSKFQLDISGNASALQQEIITLRAKNAELEAENQKLILRQNAIQLKEEHFYKLNHDLRNAQTGIVFALQELKSHVLDAVRKIQTLHDKSLAISPTQSDQGIKNLETKLTQIQDLLNCFPSDSLLPLQETFQEQAKELLAKGEELVTAIQEQQQPESKLASLLNTHVLTLEKHLVLLESMEENANYIADTMNQHILFYGLSAQTETQATNTCDVIQLLQSVMKMHTAQASKYKIALKLATTIPILEIESYGEKIKGILDNLLGNAIKFATTTVTIDMDIKYKSENQKADIIISLANDGKGMPDDIKEHYGEMGTPTDPSSPTKENRNGLGSHIIQTTLESMGEKRVQIQDHPTEHGKGCKISFSLSNVVLTQPSKIQEILELEHHKIYLKQESHILILDDNLSNRMIIKKFLTALNYKNPILEASNGKIGLDHLQDTKKTIGLIIMDLEMPVMDGYDFFKEVQNTKEFTHIPYIILSGNTGDKKMQDFITEYEIPKERFITKPIRKAGLETVITYALTHTKSKTLSSSKNLEESRDDSRFNALLYYAVIKQEPLRSTACPPQSEVTQPHASCIVQNSKKQSSR